MGCAASQPGVALPANALPANTYELPVVAARHEDHRKHHWFRLDLPAGLRAYNSGLITVRWKDQGWGNRKGHLWARVTGTRDEQAYRWTRISTHVAPHTWKQEHFTLPTGWFQDRPAGVSADAAKLELAFEVGGGGGHALMVQDARLTLEPAKKSVDRAPAAVLQARALLPMAALIDELLGGSPLDAKARIEMIRRGLSDGGRGRAHPGEAREGRRRASS